MPRKVLTSQGQGWVAFPALGWAEGRRPDPLPPPPHLHGAPQAKRFYPPLERRPPTPARSLPAQQAPRPRCAPDLRAVRARRGVRNRGPEVSAGWDRAPVGQSRVAASYRRAGGRPSATLPGARGQLVSGPRLVEGAAHGGRTGVPGSEAGGGGQQARVDERQVGPGRAAGGGHAGGGGGLSAPSAASRNRSRAPRLIKRLNPPPRGARSPPGALSRLGRALQLG